MTTDYSDCVVRDTAEQPDRSIVWLHGLGADGNDFAPIVPQLAVTSGLGVRLIFPHAPVRPVTVNGGLPMRAWYDIAGSDISRDQDREGIAASVARVDALIEGERARGIADGHIIVAGFSQGGAIALRCGLARTGLAGILALSTYLLDAADLDQWMAPANRGLDIFMAHGSEDPVVPVGLGEAAARRLEAAGLAVTWRTWPMPHAVCPEEIQAIDAWLSARLS